MIQQVRSSISLLLAFVLSTASSLSAQPPPLFNRAPLAKKAYTELPLGAIKPEAFLLDELRRVAKGMTGHLEQWHPEVCGSRNAWLGRDGDTWERGPHWIDGLYPLTKLVDDESLETKVRPWIEWTLASAKTATSARSKSKKRTSLSPAPYMQNINRKPIELIPHGTTNLHNTEFPLIDPAGR